MAEVTTKRIADCDYYKGPNAIAGIKFRTVGRELDIRAWGMNVLEIDAGCTGYPEHDHSKDGQEEVYVVLEGSGTLVAPSGEHELEAGMLVRVGPDTRRKILPGKDGIRVLAIGGTPGKAYRTA